MSVEGRRIEIRGIVQGVGFRPWVYRVASEAGITGRVRNDAAGVTIEAFGEPRRLDAFLDTLDKAPPPAASIQTMCWQSIPTEAADRFVIVASEESADRRVSIPPDLATCDACAAEIVDPANRRYRYPFTNCTNCGPRFTIARDVPYDRASTTMAPFRMCPECQREFTTVTDRRFHAQPNACPVCGPRLHVLSGAGEALDWPDPIRGVAEALRAGQIVALKGIGGFHLACDATSPFAVQRLRERKRRDAKPFAVMVASVAAAEDLAVLTDDERRLLGSIERPIVLVTRREGAMLADEVAPNNPLVGLLVAYSPLHHLLLADVNRPLVMTSGNFSEEPIAFTNDEALDRLGGIADLFLVHDREIETRADDSVARVIAGAPVVLRRSRGYVPRGILLDRRFERPVLACGALLKNTFCFGVGETAHLGPHIGDLENLETFASFTASLDRMQRFLRVRPEIVAYDLHPQYLSTQYALERPEPVKIGVQHHHAHVASAMAEHRLEGPVLGLAYDGTGYGTDGAAWGGELLLAWHDRFERLATFRPIALAGGDQAIRRVWRLALAMLDDAFEGEAPIDRLDLFNHVSAREIAVVREMIAARLNSPLAHGVGRYFDAIGALVLGRTESRFEGQVALEWNLVADPGERGRYPFAINRTVEPWTFDTRPLVRHVVADLLAGQPAATISARFHNTLARASAEMVRTAARHTGRLPVVLTGGCFQNARLAEGLLRELNGDFAVHLHRDVPPGDGGLSLGQAVVADAVARGGI